MGIFSFFKNNSKQVNTKNTKTKCNNSIITLGTCILNKELVKPTHQITSIKFCNTGIVSVNIQHHGRVENIVLNFVHAQDIGFINVEALSEYCRK